MPGHFPRRWPLALVSVCLLAAAGCGSDDPAPPPAAPTPSTSSVQVRAAGNATDLLETGQTRQLSATATLSTGATSDVTSQATWTTSTPSVATVSGTGLVTAVGEGTADIGATYQGVRGSFGVGVKPLRCSPTISPATATYDPFGGGTIVQVQVASAQCRWSARSDAAWLPFLFEAPVPGNGAFGYTAPPNSTTDPRVANIVVTTSSGETATHTLTVNRTTGCSYVTDPEQAEFSASGGTGQFRVVTTPNNCQWTAVNGLQALGVQITSGFSGTGGGLVRYSVQAHTRDVDADGFIEIAGLSGQNPNGRHRIVLKKR
jgi:hypothetical protein